MNEKPLSPLDEAQTEFNLQRADRVVEDARSLLQVKDPEQIAAENGLSRQFGLPPEIVSRLDKYQVNVATKAPSREKAQLHARQEPDFIAALDETEALKEAPDKYDDFYTIWTLGRQLKGMAGDVVDAFRSGAEDKDLGEERAAVARQISQARLRGEEPSEDLLQRRFALDERARAAGDLKPLTPTGAVRVTTMAGLQSLDGFMIDTETTDALAHRIFPESIAEKIDGPGGPAEKLFTGLYALAATASFKNTIRANLAYESYQLEKGNLLYSLQQIEEESGQRIDPELTEMVATYYGLIASGVEVASTLVEFPIIGRAGAAVKSLIFKKTVDALANPTVGKVAGEIIKDILIGAAAESIEEGAQFGAETLATESWKLLSGKFAEVTSFEDIVDKFMQPETLQELKLNMQAGFVGGLGLGSVGGAVRGADLVKDAKRHQDNQKAFTALAKGIEETDLRERGSGELVAALASRAGAGKVDKLYFEPDSIEEVLNQQGITDANRVIEGLATEIANARTEMRPVEMDAGTFAARLAGSTLFDELKDHIRYSKDDRSNFERKTDREKALEVEKSVLEEMKESDRELFEKSSQKVRDEFEKKILEIGRNTKQEARANSAVFEGIYRSIATALTVSQNRLVTPEEVLRIHQPLEFQGPDSKAQTAGRQAEETFAQTKLRAAVRVDGVVFQGDTHAAAADAAVKSGVFSQISDATTLDELVASRDDNKPEFFNERGGHRLWDDQGFVDEGGNWLERDEALALTGSDNSGGIANRDPSPDPRVEAPLQSGPPRVASNVNFDLDKDAPIRADATPPPGRDLLRWLPSRTKDGKLLGVPEDVRTIAQWRDRHNFVKQLVEEGAAGRFWYENSGDAVLMMMGGNFVEAERFVQLLAIYSPQAKVDVNTIMAVRAYTQWKMGIPREQFKVNSGDKDRKAIAVLYDGLPFEGRKTNSFYMNLMHRIVERATDAQLDEMKIDPDLLRDIKRPVTSDMWVFRAYGYKSDAAAGDKGSGRYSTTETDMNRIAAELNESLLPGEEPWLPHQVQAAMWTAIKARFENATAKKRTNDESLRKGYSFINDKGKIARKSGAENVRKHIAIWRKHALRVDPKDVAKGIAKDAYSFADVLSRMTFAVTWEAVPAPVFDHPIMRATPEQQADFQAAAARIIIDEDGFDEAAGLAGAGVEWATAGEGGFEASIASNYIARLMPNKPAGDFSTAEADLYARMVQYIFKQKAVPWFRADRTLKMSKSFRVQVRDSEDPSKLKTLRLFDTVKAARAFAEKGAPGERIVSGKPQSLGIAFRYSTAPTRAETEAIFTEMRAIFGENVGFTKTAPDEITIVNYRSGEGLPFLVDDDEFREKANEFGQRTGSEESVEFGVQSDYGPDHDWAADPKGEGLLASSSLAGRPDLHPWLRDRRAEFEDLLVETARALGDPGYSVLETFNQLRDGAADQRAAEGRENFRRLGLLGDDGEPIALADLHKGTKNSESAQRAVYRSIGLEVAEGSKPNLKIYPLQRVFGETVEEVEGQLKTWLDSIGWSYGVFGPKNGDRPAYYPDFSDPSTPTYDQKKVWIFDPSLEEGSFRDHAYTLAWRVTHEVAHGIVNDRLTQKYGGRGRRAGAMGVEIKGPYFKGGAPLTLADAMRAVEWEHETFIEQRRILDEVFGVQISDEEFALENGVNMADAVYRSITGQFGNPGEIGVIPTAIDPQQVLSKSFEVLREVSSQINGDTSEQLGMRLDDEVQGQYVRTSAGSIIKMTQASDLTTLLHEAAHFYLSTISQMVRNGTADDRISADLEAILRYTGVSTAAELTLPYADGRQWNGRVDIPHEVFARSFEAYLAEGKAPSREMRGVFRRFRSWMAGVYGSLKEVARRLGVQLNPEIRGVFDRMLAVDEVMREAEEMKPLFETREDAGMTEEQWETYLEAFAEIRDEARDRVMQPLVRRVTAEKKRQRRELADSLYDRFADEVDQEPVYRALRFLRAEEQVEGLESDGLSRDAILALYARPETAAKVLASVPRGTVQRAGGHDPALIAELFGFKTPSALLQALGNVQPREKEIARRVDAEIASRPEFFEREVEIEARSLVGGEELAKRIRIELQGLRELAKTTLLPGARRAVAEVGAPPAGASRARVKAAQEALDAAQARGNEEAIAKAQVELVAAEATAKAEREARAQQAGARRRAREIEAVLNDQAIRERAETLVANRPAGEIRSDRKIWAKRMEADQKKARELVAARDYLGALRAMERAALLNAMIAEADKATTRQPKILTHARSFDTRKQRDKLRTAGAATELGLIDLLLAKYDLRTDVPIDPAIRGPERVREIARRRQERARELAESRAEEFPSLEKWMAEKKAELEVVAIDESLFLNPERRHWKELTVAELDGLHATLKNMEQIAKNEVRSSKAAQKQKYSDMADQVVVAMTLKNVDKTARNRKEDDLWRNKIRKTIDTVDALHINMKRLFRWMGGDDETANPLLTIERWWRDATAYELDRLDGLNRQYMDLIQKLYQSGKDYRSKIDVPAFGEPMTRAQAISFALNAGTTSNWSKLLRGYKMVNGDQLDEAKGNKVLEILSDEEWDFVQSVWDLVNSLWDEASENHFQMTGERPAKVEAREFITPTGKIMKGGYFPIAYDPIRSDVVARVKERGQLMSLFEHYAADPRTKHGFLEKRKDKFAAPILLDLDLIGSHLADVVHDIAWRKPLRDSWKVLHQPQLKAAILEMYGIEYFDAIEHRIRMLAGAQSSMIKNLKWMQNGLQRFQSAQTAYMLAGAFSTTFVQLTSFTNAIPRISDSTLEATGLIAKSLWLVVTDFKATKAKIHESSVIMRHRAKSMDASIREANAELEGRTDRVAKARRLGYSMIAAADYFVSASVYLARYEKVLTETMDRDRAIREAEFAVERTQGAGNVKDMAQIQDADPLLRPFTMFYSYFSAFYSELHSMAEDASEGKIGKAASAYLLIAVIPGMLSDLIRFNIPDEEDDDEQAKAWALWAAYHLFANPFSSVILMRDVTNFAASKIGGRAFASFEPTPLTGFFDQAARTIETIGSAVGSDDDINPYAVTEEIIAGVGMAMGLPFARQLNIIANNLAIAHDEGLELGVKDLLVRRRKSE